LHSDDLIALKTFSHFLMLFLSSTIYFQYLEECLQLKNEKRKKRKRVSKKEHPAQLADLQESTASTTIHDIHYDNVSDIVKSGKHRPRPYRRPGET